MRVEVQGGKKDFAKTLMAKGTYWCLSIYGIGSADRASSWFLTRYKTETLDTET